MNRLARRSWHAGLAVLLALASGSVAALGLGQIELRSKLGEPLLAEIPIVSNDPAELEQLRAGLASPATFARVGLQAPDATVANLRFVSALDARGNPVIRVTSVAPIEQPLLTFLIEVDWGQGRLVREYSTLLDAPRTVAAPLLPPIEAPQLAPSNTIVRAPPGVPAVTPPVAPAIAPTPRMPRPAVAPAPVAAVPAPVPAPPPAVTPRPAAQPPAAVVERAPDSPPPAAATARSAEYGAVARGENLSQIAGQLDLGVSLDQAMIALLRANPAAFIGGNINLLKQGAVLRVPSGEQLAALDAAQASALVRTQVRQWRESQRPPAAIAAAAAAAVPAGEGRPAAPRAAAVNPAIAGPASADARLEIVPPGASSATRAGTQSGIAAGGEGEMLRQQLQQTKETLAARDAELVELQSRVAELEQLQGDQQQLLSMKDTELAAVQQRLASAQQAEPAAAPAEAASGAGLAWVLGGAGLLLLALLAGWWMRRRAAVAPRFRAPAPRSALADAFAPPTAAARPVAPAPDDPEPSPPNSASAERPPVIAGDDPLPFWDRRQRTARPSGRPTVAPAVVAPDGSTGAPAWHGAATEPTPAPVSPTAPPSDVAGAPAVDAAGQARLDLARAYVDLGDHDSARQLLGEVAADGDAEDRQQASRMLRELE